MNDLFDSVRNANILIVDDRPGNVALLQAVLKESGYQNIHTTTDSREVVDLYKNNDFDLILLDIRMPHVDGLQVMEKLSAEGKDDYLPILILTAEDDMDTRLKALQAGAKDFVTKPFNTAEVLNRISNMLEVRALYNERLRQNEVLEEKVRERTLELEQSNEELKQTRLEIINRLGLAGEYRDGETGLHVVRMSKYCHQLALATGKGEAWAELLLMASPMHDLGKIGIPDSILLKEGKLTPEEMEEMQSHTKIGAEILGDNDSAIMRMARTVALAHHERWDGAGYPNRLSGEDIPLEARITTIADVFDALTTERPYKKGWPVQDAVDYINDKSGEQFDPNLVRLFNEQLPELLKIKDAYTDRY